MLLHFKSYLLNSQLKTVFMNLIYAVKLQLPKMFWTTPKNPLSKVLAFFFFFFNNKTLFFFSLEALLLSGSLGKYTFYSDSLLSEYAMITMPWWHVFLCAGTNVDCHEKQAVYGSGACASTILSVKFWSCFCFVIKYLTKSFLPA